MKKIVLSLMILMIFSAACLAAPAGKWSLSLNNMIIGNLGDVIVSDNASYLFSVPSIGYNLTDNSVVNVGYMSKTMDDDLSTISMLQYTYYFGNGNLAPHIGLCYLFVNHVEEEGVYVTENNSLSFLFGTAVNIYDDLSVEFDLRPISIATRQTIKTDIAIDKDGDYVNALLLNIKPTFSIKYTF